MNRALSLAVLTFALAAVLPAVASGGGTAGTLNLDTRLPATWQTVSCPAGTTGANPHCYAISGQGVVRGLGQTSESYAFVIDDYDSGSSNFHFTATVDVPGKGTIDVSGATPSPSCTCTPYGVALDFTVTGGTGVFDGAYGSGTTVFNTSTDATWSGTLSVPGYTFDTAAPVISGKVPKTVKVRRGAGRARVRYAVSALDPDEGSLPVTCTPRSGSLFKIGRRTVRCEATDANGNTATRRFTVKVERR